MVRYDQMFDLWWWICGKMSKYIRFTKYKYHLKIIREIESGQLHSIWSLQKHCHNVLYLDLYQNIVNLYNSKLLLKMLNYISFSPYYLKVYLFKSPHVIIKINSLEVALQYLMFTKKTRVDLCMRYVKNRNFK